MIELVIFAAFYIVLAIALFYRVFKGPTASDRIVAVDSIETLTIVALMLYSLYTRRGIFMDIAIVVAVFGYVSTVFIARYLEGRL